MRQAEEEAPQQTDEPRRLLPFLLLILVLALIALLVVWGLYR